MVDRDWQGELDGTIDDVLDLLFAAADAGVELDPLATIMQRMQARGHQLNMDELPPLARMMLG
jgi:hypothetical protein